MTIYIIKDIKIADVNITDSLIYYHKNDNKIASTEFKKFHDDLTRSYPCLSVDDESVWSDGPLIDNFGNKIACIELTIWSDTKRNKKAREALIFLLKLATQYNFDVYIWGEKKIRRPYLPYKHLLKFGINLLLIILIGYYFYYISDFLFKIENEIKISISKKSKRAFIELILYNIAKLFNNFIKYDTYIVLYKYILMILALFPLNNLHKYFVSKRQVKFRAFSKLS